MAFNRQECNELGFQAGKSGEDWSAAITRVATAVLQNNAELVRAYQVGWKRGAELRKAESSRDFVDCGDGLSVILKEKAKR
jgi:hypothetical protein